MAANTPHPSLFLSRQAEGMKLLAEVLPHLVTGIAVLEADGSVVSWDSQAERITGYPLQKAQELGFVQLFTPAEVMRHIIRKAYYGVPTLNEYVELSRSDNSRISVTVQCSAQSSLGGGAERVVVAFRELGPIQNRLGQYEHTEMLGRLASSLSHEIRNPLGVIFLHMDVLEEELRRLAPDDRTLMMESLTEIKTELSRMHELVQDYLSLARLTNLRREPEDLGALLEEVVQEFQELLRTRGIACSSHGFDNLDRVFCHKGALRRALFNVMQNAIDAMSPGGTLILRCWQEDAWVHLEIRDTGSGISEEQLPWVFIPFHTTKPDGTGLGLYIVHEIITAHGGAIQVTSTPGQGTTVIMRLSLTPVGEVPAPDGAWAAS